MFKLHTSQIFDESWFNTSPNFFLCDLLKIPFDTFFDTNIFDKLQWSRLVLLRWPRLRRRIRRVANEHRNNYKILKSRMCLSRDYLESNKDRSWDILATALIMKIHSTKINHYCVSIKLLIWSRLFCREILAENKRRGFDYGQLICLIPCSIV